MAHAAPCSFAVRRQTWQAITVPCQQEMPLLADRHFAGKLRVTDTTRRPVHETAINNEEANASEEARELLGAMARGRASRPDLYLFRPEDDDLARRYRVEPE